MNFGFVALSCNTHTHLQEGMCVLLYLIILSFSSLLVARRGRLRDGCGFSAILTRTPPLLGHNSKLFFGRVTKLTVKDATDAKHTTQHDIQHT